MRINILKVRFRRRTSIMLFIVIIESVFEFDLDVLFFKSKNFG